MIVSETTHPALYDVFGRIAGDIGSPRREIYVLAGPYDRAQLRLADSAISALDDEERARLAMGSFEEQGRIAARSPALALADGMIAHFAAQGAPGRDR